MLELNFTKCDISVLEMVPAPQTHFAPLSEALCKVIADLNGEARAATTTSIRVKLEENFPEMQVPLEEILLKSLAGLIKERKLYCTGSGYYVAGPDTYRQRIIPPIGERQMLMTNEEAIVKLHGSTKECSLAIQVDEMDIAAAWNSSSSSFLHASKRNRDISCQMTQDPPSADLQMMERSHSLKIMRVKGNRPKSNDDLDRYGSFKETSTTKRLSYIANEINRVDFQKGEKQSMLAKILKRMQSLKDRSNKHVAFSAQFPPLEWLQSEKRPCHSVATQTALQKVCTLRTENDKHKIPWEESDHSRNNDFMHFFTPSGQPKTLPCMNRNNNKKNGNVPMRQSYSRHSPSHRYSYGTLNNSSKRRHRHRRSSSESPKIIKNNSNPSNSTSKSPTDQSDLKFSPSSSSGSAVTANPKTTVNPQFRTLDSPQKFKFEIPNSSLQYKYNKRNEIPSKEEIRKEPTLCSPKLLKHIQPEPTIKENTAKKANNQDSETDPLACLSDIKLALSESSSELSISFNGFDSPKKDPVIQPPVLKRLVEIPKATSPKKENKPPETDEIIVDNTVSVEVVGPPSNAPKGNVSTTVVTEETTVTKENGNSKVVTITSITTNLSKGKSKGKTKNSPVKEESEKLSNTKEKAMKNDLNLESNKMPRLIDCSSSCNIITEVK